MDQLDKRQRTQITYLIPNVDCAKQKRESVTRKVIDYITLVLKEYKKRHYSLERAIHWELCRNLGFDHSHKCYEVERSKVLASKKYNMLWDIQNDRTVGAKPAGSDEVDKENRKCHFTVPNDEKPI